MKTIITNTLLFMTLCFSSIAQEAKEVAQLARLLVCAWRRGDGGRRALVRRALVPRELPNRAALSARVRSIPRSLQGGPKALCAQARLGLPRQPAC